MWGNLLSRLWGSAHEHLSVYISAHSALGDRIYRCASCCRDRGCNRQIRLLTRLDLAWEGRLPAKRLSRWRQAFAAALHQNTVPLSEFVAYRRRSLRH
jgi:hypothetical protein